MTAVSVVPLTDAETKQPVALAFLHWSFFHVMLRSGVDAPSA